MHLGLPADDTDGHLVLLAEGFQRLLVFLAKPASEAMAFSSRSHLGHFHDVAQLPVGLEAPLVRPPAAQGSGGVLAFRATPALDDARLVEIMPAIDGKWLLESNQVDGATDSPLQFPGDSR